MTAKGWWRRCDSISRSCTPCCRLGEAVRHWDLASGTAYSQTLVQPSQTLVQPTVRHRALSSGTAHNQTLVQPIVRHWYSLQTLGFVLWYSPVRHWYSPQSDTGTAHSQTLVQPSQTLVQLSQTLVQPSQTLVQPSDTGLCPLLQPSQTLIQPSQTLVQPTVGHGALSSGTTHIQTLVQPQSDIDTAQSDTGTALSWTLGFVLW